MKIITADQRSPEWFKARRGIPTASDFDKIVTTEGKPSKQRQKYMYQLAGERMGATIDEGYTNFAMQQGIDREEEARSLYEMARGSVQKVGLCLSDCGRYGASPDGLIGEEGIIEIKCPQVATHIEYMLADRIPTDYFQQTQGQLLVTGRKWVDFMSHFPGLQPKIIRDVPDRGFQAVLRASLERFCEELDTLVNQIEKGGAA